MNPQFLIDFVDQLDWPFDGVKGRLTRSWFSGAYSKRKNEETKMGHKKKRAAIRRMLKGGNPRFTPCSIYDII